jgi:putative molybdopterin biosynthesis protein
MFMNQEEFYTIKEVSELFKVAYLTVYRWIKEGKLEAYKLGKQYKIKKADIDKFIKESKVNINKYKNNKNESDK